MESFKLLKIDSGKAFFLKNDDYVSVASIEKEDILQLIKCIAVSGENKAVIELDECNSDSKQIINAIEKTIYLELFAALNDLIINRELYLGDIKKQFDDIEKQYDLTMKEEPTKQEKEQKA